MPNIEFPDEQFQRLTLVAQAAGFTDVSAFIASFANEPIEDPRGMPSDEELRDNVAAMERGETEIATGGGHDMKNAMTEIADKYGLNIKR